MTTTKNRKATKGKSKSKSKTKSKSKSKLVRPALHVLNYMYMDGAQGMQMTLHCPVTGQPVLERQPKSAKKAQTESAAVTVLADELPSTFLFMALPAMDVPTFNDAVVPLEQQDPYVNEIHDAESFSTWWNNNDGMSDDDYTDYDDASRAKYDALRERLSGANLFMVIMPIVAGGCGGSHKECCTFVFRLPDAVTDDV